jgi:hypothetical protein
MRAALLVLLATAGTWAAPFGKAPVATLSEPEQLQDEKATSTSTSTGLPVSVYAELADDEEESQGVLYSTSASEGMTVGAPHMSAPYTRLSVNADASVSDSVHTQIPDDDNPFDDAEYNDDVLRLGMRPLHLEQRETAGPQWFQHRFQHHNPATDTLTFFQYRAKRNEHVVVLDAHDVESCTFEQLPPTPDLPEHVKAVKAVTLVMSSDSVYKPRLTQGAIVITREFECLHQGKRDQRVHLQEQLLHQTHVQEQPLRQSQLRFLTKPADMHDIFEVADIEYFTGRPHVFNESRAQRLANLRRMNSSDELGFADTHDVLTTAYKASAARLAARKAEAARRQAARVEAERKAASRDSDHTVMRSQAVSFYGKTAWGSWKGYNQAAFDVCAAIPPWYDYSHTYMGADRPYVQCAKQGGFCSCPAGCVAFGVNGNFDYSTGSINCTLEAFGSNATNNWKYNPEPGYTKYCHCAYKYKFLGQPPGHYNRPGYDNKVYTDDGMKELNMDQQVSFEAIFKYKWENGQTSLKACKHKKVTNHGKTDQDATVCAGTDPMTISPTPGFTQEISASDKTKVKDAVEENEKHEATNMHETFRKLSKGDDFITYQEWLDAEHVDSELLWALDKGVENSPILGPLGLKPHEAKPDTLNWAKVRTLWVKAFRRADISYDLKVDMHEYRAWYNPPKIEVELALTAAQTVKTTGNVHVIKRISKYERDVEVFAYGKALKSLISMDYGIQLKGTMTKQWDIPILEKFCPPYVCYKGTIGDSFVMLGLGLSFDSKVVMEFMARVKFGFKRNIVFEGDIQVHQIISEGQKRKVLDVTPFKPSLEGSSQPSSEKSREVEVKSETSLALAPTLAVGLWADVTPKAPGWGSWLLKSASTEFSVEVVPHVKLSAVFNLLYSSKTSTASDGTSKTELSSLYPLVGPTTSTPSCSQWENNNVSLAIDDWPRPRTWKTATCKVRLKEIMDGGSSEKDARAQLFKEAHMLPGSTTNLGINTWDTSGINPCGPKICAKAQKADYFGVWGACDKEHQVEIDVKLEVKIEVRMTQWINIEVADGWGWASGGFKYGPWIYYVIPCKTRDVTHASSPVQGNCPQPITISKAYKDASTPQFLSEETFHLLAWCADWFSTGLQAEEQSQLLAPPENNTARDTLLYVNESGAASTVGADEDANGENDAPHDNVQTIVRTEGDAGGSDGGPRRGDPQGVGPRQGAALGRGARAHPLGRRAARHQDQGNDLGAVATGMRPHHSAGASAEDPLLFQYRFQHHDPLTDTLTYYQYKAKRHAHVVILGPDDVDLCTFEQLPPRGNQSKLTAMTLVMRDENAHRKRLTHGAIIVSDGFQCSDKAGHSTAVNVQARLVAKPIVRSQEHESGFVHLVCTTIPAEFQELFEHSTVEYFKGKPKNLQLSRAKRYDSLAYKGQTAFASTIAFASTEQVILEAKAATRKLHASHVTAVALPLLNSTEPRSIDKSRMMGLSWWPWGGGSNNSGEEESCGTPLLESVELKARDCGKSVKDSTDLKDCYWKKSAAEGRGEWALRPGNTYKVAWTTIEKEIPRVPANSKVMLSVYEVDQDEDHDYCMDLTPTGGVDISSGGFEFNLPRLNDFMGIGTCGFGDEDGIFPELRIYVKTKIPSCNNMTDENVVWPHNGWFRLVLKPLHADDETFFEEDISFTYKFEKAVSSSSSEESAGAIGNTVSYEPMFQSYGGTCVCPNGISYEVAKVPDTHPAWEDEPFHPKNKTTDPTGYKEEQDAIKASRLACAGGRAVPRPGPSGESAAKHRQVVCADPVQSTKASMGAKVGVEFGCRDCVFDVTGDVHILARTSEYNPFEELWIYGDLAATAKVNLFARAYSQMNYQSPVWPLFDAICAPGVCYKAKLAGVDFKVGAYVALNISFDASFDAEIEWTYDRVYSVPGQVEAHAIRDIDNYKLNYKRSYKVVGFDKLLVTAPDGSEPKSPSITFNVDAAANLHILPSIKIGMFADASGATTTAYGGLAASLGAKGEVEIAVKMVARATFKFRAAFGPKMNFIMPMPRNDDCTALSTYLGGESAPADWGPTCCANGTMPYCWGVCSERHDTQFNIECILDVGFSLSLFMKASLENAWTGTHSRTLDLMWWVRPSTAASNLIGLTLVPTHEYTQFLSANLHVLSVCKTLIPSLLPEHGDQEGRSVVGQGRHSRLSG